MDDFSKLEPTAHMLAWLSDDYQAAILEEVARALAEQSENSTLDEFGSKGELQGRMYFA